MTGPLVYPDPPEERERRSARYLARRDAAENAELRAEHDATMAARGPQEAREGAAEAVRVFGRLPGGRDGKGPRW